LIEGILGCPSLPLSNANKEQQGCILIGVKGEGSHIRAIDSETETKISVSSKSDPKANSLSKPFILIALD
jgi:hypothetical protein